MRGNIIEELYYGNIDPQDRGYRPKSPVKKASDSLNDLEELKFWLILKWHIKIGVLVQGSRTFCNELGSLI